MSLMHSVTLTTNTHFNSKNIDCLMNNLLKIDANIFKEINNELEKIQSNDFSQFYIQPSQEELKNGGPTLFVIFQDTSFNLWIKKNKQNNLELDISCFSIEWKKEFSRDESYIDFGRYIRLLLKISKPFEVTSITTETF